MEASMSTVPTNLSSVTPRGICTKGASFTSAGISPWPNFSLSPSWKPEKLGRCRTQSMADTLLRACAGFTIDIISNQ